MGGDFRFASFFFNESVLSNCSVLSPGEGLCSGSDTALGIGSISEV